MPHRSCFVIMPFSTTPGCSEAQWTAIYNDMIRPAVQGARLGFLCTRSAPTRGSIIGHIVANLASADVVIADLTERNPNVFYELGVRHALRNRTILLSRDVEDIPSDLRSYATIIYTIPDGMEKFRRDMRAALRDVVNVKDRHDNPVADFLRRDDEPLWAFHRVSSARKIGLGEELSRNLSRCDKAIENLVQARDAKTAYGAYFRFDAVALQELVATHYVVLSKRDANSCSDTAYSIELINAYLSTLRLLRRVPTQWHIKRLQTLQKQLRHMLEVSGSALRRIQAGNVIDTALPAMSLSNPTHEALLLQRQTPPP